MTIEKSTAAIPASRHLAWHEVEMFGLVHFGINTFTGREWGYGDEDPKLFNPDAFDAMQIVKACRDGGFKGFILTCKHHDGFCLWPTMTTEHCIRNTPWRKGQGDIVREFEQACRKLGLKFGVYLSPWDRNHPEYGRPAYVEVYKRQLRELLTGYGELFEVWFDGANGGDGFYGGAREKRSIDPSTYYQWETLWGMVRELQPNACIFNGPDLRWVGNENGIAGEPCWNTITPLCPTDPHLPPGIKSLRANHPSRADGIPDGTHWVPAECDFPIRPGWFHRDSEDSKVMPSDKLVTLYFQSIGRGGGGMSIGLAPNRHGVLSEPDVKTLKGFKEKLDVIFHDNLIKGCGLSAKLDHEIEFNIIEVKERIEKGHTLRSFVVEAMLDGKWTRIAEGEGGGYRRLIRIPYVKTSALRLLTTPQVDETVIKSFGVYAAPSSAAAPLVRRLRNGEVELYCEDPGPAIRYTTDGSEPTISSPLYAKPFPLPKSCVVRAFSYLPQRPESRSPVASLELDHSKSLWKVAAVSMESLTLNGEADNVIDENDGTVWHTYACDGGVAPQWIEIDMGERLVIDSFTMTPRCDAGHGTPCNYELHLSLDGKAWRLASSGEFSNIKANPVKQIVRFAKPEEARFLRFTALRSVDDADHVAIAELGVRDAV